MNSLDIFVQNYFFQIRTEQLNEYVYLFSRIFDFSVFFVLICIFVAFIIHVFRKGKYSYLFAFAMLSQAVIVYLLKNFFDINRPVGAVMEAFGKSFPSYHATSVSVFFIMLMYIFDSHLSKYRRILFNTFCIIMIILVSSSRLYLGVHWFSDVVAGVVLGGLISYISILIFKKLK